MGITVAGAINTATTAVVRPRLSYSVVHPVTAASVVVPAAAVVYIDIVLGAALDTTGRYKFVTDASVVVDALAFDTSKLLTDAPTFSDVARLSFTRPLADSIGSLDAVTTAVAKALADDYGLTDAVARTLAKAAFDSFGFSDTDTFDLSKLIQDGVGMNDLFDATDGSLYSFVKNVANVVFANEQLARDVSKKLADAVAALSTHALYVQKAPFVDATGEPSDFSFRDTLLGKADSIGTLSATSFDATKTLTDAFSYADFHSAAVDKLSADSVGTLSTHALYVQKAPFVDATGEPSDSIFSATTLGKTDSVGTLSATAFDVTKPLADAFSYAEFFAAAVNKPLADAIVPNDSHAAVVEKAAYETTYTTEHTAYDLAKALGDSVAFVDVLYAVRIFQRAYNDTLAASDYQILAVTKPLADVVSTADASSTVLNKLLADGFALNDLADVGDGITFLLVQSIANVALISDNSTRQLAKSRTDITSATDSGSLVNQGYCDLTYFAEDYVGATRSF